MADLPIVNAIEEQTETSVENRETLQRSFRASLGALGSKIKAQTSVLSTIADTMNSIVIDNTANTVVEQQTKQDVKQQTNQDVENRETLQRSFRGSIGALGSKIKEQTGILKGISNTMSAAYNIDQQQLLQDAENRLEQRRKEEAEAEAKAKEGKLATKIKGGLLDTLKKAFLGAALVGLVTAVVENWNKIKETFEKIKPSLIKFKDAVVNVSEMIIPPLLENFDTIAKGLLGLWVGIKAWKGIQLMASAITAMKAGFLAVQAATITAGARFSALATSIKVFSIAGLTAAWGGITAGLLALKAGLLSIGAAIAPAIAVAAPIIAAVAGVALVLYGLKKAFEEAQTVFAETESVSLAITEGLSKLFATIIGFVPDLLKSATSWILGKLGFEEAAEALDTFSITDFIQNGISNIFGKMRIIFMKAINGVVSIINGLLDWVPGFGPNTIDPVFNIAQEEFKLNQVAESRRERQQMKFNEDNEETATAAREVIEGVGSESGGVAGAQVNAQSAQAASAAGNVVVTTVAPTNISAPTSTSVSSQTNITPGATRSRRAYRGRRAPAYA
jgi:hypothetical protein